MSGTSPTDCFNDCEQVCQRDVPLNRHTWFALGGPARWMLTPQDPEELSKVLNRCAENGITWRILGRGANILARDGVFDGAVIKLTGPAWERIEFADPVTDAAGAIVRCTAASGADFTRIVRLSVDRALSGIEHLAGIPGTFGGILHMNAGGRYGEIADVVDHVRLMHPDGTIETRAATDCGFGYRTSRFHDGVILDATLNLRPGEAAEIRARYKEIWGEKYANQPPVSKRSVGCIFKNPPGEQAGKLLDKAQLKGTRVGGAEISPRHANFILAGEGATAQNVLDLIRLARERVREQTGIELELEVEVW